MKALALLVILLAPLSGVVDANCSWQAFYPQNLDEGYNVLTSTFAFSPTDAWAAGWRSHGSQVLHFDGVQWEQMPAPTSSYTILSITGSSDADLWAAGYTNANSPALLHWNGADWEAAALGSIGTANGLFQSVVEFGAPYVWAAGSYSAFGHASAPLIMHFNGKRWILDAVYTPPNNAILRSISGTSRSNIWTGGSGDPKTGGLIERWQPTRKEWVRVANPSFGINVISARSRTDVWAVGGPSGGQFVERWDGKTWTQIPYSQRYGNNSYLWGLDATPSTGFTWVAGFYDNSGNRSPYIDRYRGGRWQDTKVLEIGTNGTVLTAMSPVPATSDEWAAGFYNGPGQTQAFDLIERWTCPAGTH